MYSSSTSYWLMQIVHDLFSSEKFSLFTGVNLAIGSNLIRLEGTGLMTFSSRLIRAS